MVTHGGPLRGFDRLMPAFGDALTREEIDLILEYVQTLYEDKSWPRGEFNLPLALGTEKAFPEDEVVMKTTVGTGESGSVMNKLIYEKRFGSQTQIEVVAPFGWQELSDESVADEGLGRRSRGSGHRREEGPLPQPGHGDHHQLHLRDHPSHREREQGLREGLHGLRALPDRGPTPALRRLRSRSRPGWNSPPTPRRERTKASSGCALGKTFTAGGEWGRAFSPMVEFLGARELEGGTAVWDIMPEVHFTLNQRQHIMANVGVRFPSHGDGGEGPSGHVPSSVGLVRRRILRGVVRNDY